MTVTNAISDSAENAILKLIFNATAWANIAQDGTSPITNIQNALHTLDPGDSGLQNQNEISYGSYARAAVLRQTGGWTVTANSVSPVAAIAFPASTAGTGTATHWTVGKTSTGATEVFWRGDVTPNIAVTGAGITPQLTTSSTITLD